MQQLDDEPAEDEPLDIRHLLEEEISHSRRIIQMHRVEKNLIKIAIPVGALILGLFVFFLLGDMAL